MIRREIAYQMGPYWKKGEEMKEVDKNSFESTAKIGD
jgi:hypothetical protein